jgi:hypothetical protein
VFLVIVDCGRIAAKLEVIPILGRGSVADHPTKTPELATILMALNASSDLVILGGHTFSAV